MHCGDRRRRRPPTRSGPGQVARQTGWIDGWRCFVFVFFFYGGDDEGRKKNVDDLVRERDDLYMSRRSQINSFMNL
jgi:hypothetical protein